MAKLKGFYINLDKDKERERILRDVLNKKGKLSVYEKFTAIEGNTEEASKKSLRAGEQEYGRLGSNFSKRSSRTAMRIMITYI